MTSLLVEWVNDELQLEPPLTEETLAEELGSGFILGALLHRHNQLAEHERLRRRDTADARIENFCVLEPTLASLGVRFDANAALGIMNARPGAAAMVLYRDALVHILANAALHTDKLPRQWQQKTRYFFEDAFLAPQGPLDEDQTGIVYVEDVMALVESWEVLPEVREMPLNDYVAWTDPIAANPAAHPQLGAAGITEEGGEVTYAEREEGAEEGSGGDYVASDAEGG